MQEQHLVEDIPNTSVSQKPVQPDPELIAPVIQEVGGVKGLEPTRYGDWEKNGRCVDF
jgi:hypothetical protein